MPLPRQLFRQKVCNQAELPQHRHHHHHRCHHHHHHDADHDDSVYVCHELELNDARRTSEVQAADLVVEAADVFAQLDLGDDDDDDDHDHHHPNPVVQIYQLLLEQDLLLALLKCVTHHSAPAHDRHTHGLHTGQTLPWLS